MTAPRVDFRPLAEDDLPTLFAWLARPHVRRWWGREPASYPELVAKYGPRARPGSSVDAFVVRVDGADAGYAQKYRIEAFPEYRRLAGLEGEEGVVGMDLLLADEWRCNQGLGAFVIRRFFHDVVMADARARACVAGPHEGNAGSIRAFEKAGFRRWRTATNERGERECLMRRDRDHARYTFEPIRPAAFDACVALCREMYVTSFGTEEGLAETMGEDNALYLEQLAAKIAQIPEGNVHLRRDGEIVGQLEMRLLDDEPEVAYLSLIHVAAPWRGHGLGKRLHEHALEVARARGKRVMRLTVGQRNREAMAFYRRLGWLVVGTRPHRMPVVVMERPVNGRQ